MLRWAPESLLDLTWEEIGEHYGRYRLHVPEAERAMARSLERYGQLSPVVVCRREERYELIDGFKRLGAVRGLAQMSSSVGPAHGGRRAHGEGRHLRAESRRRPHAGTGRSLDHSGAGARGRDEPGGGGGAVGTPQELGVPAAGADRAVGAKARDELRVGLLSPTAARQIVRLPQGNQTRSAGSDPARGAVERGTERRGGSVAGMLRTRQQEYSWRILAKRSRRPRECSPRCAIRG